MCLCISYDRQAKLRGVASRRFRLACHAEGIATLDGHVPLAEAERPPRRGRPELPEALLRRRDLEETDAIPAGALGLVESGIGGFQQGYRLGGIGAKDNTLGGDKIRQAGRHGALLLAEGRARTLQIKPANVRSRIDRHRRPQTRSRRRVPRGFVVSLGSEDYSAASWWKLSFTWSPVLRAARMPAS